LALRGGSPRGVEDRRALLGQLDRARAEFDGGAARSMDECRRQAYGVLTSPAVARAFDLAREPEKLRDRYGRHLWGQACLLARRLAEAGPAGVSVLPHPPESRAPVANPGDHPRHALPPRRLLAHPR